MNDGTDELTMAIKELTETLEALRTDLEQGRTPPRPRFRPPTPEELATFGDEVAIPATIGVLKLNIKALETLQRTLKARRRSQTLRDDADAVASRTRQHSSAIRETTLSHLDFALEELQNAVSGGSLEADERTRDLLEDARRLRSEVDRRLHNYSETTEGGESTDEAYRIEISTEDVDSSARDTGESASENPNDSGVDVDVDAELETLKEQYASENEDPSPVEDSEAADGDQEEPSDRADGSESAEDTSAGIGNDEHDGSSGGDSSDENSEQNRKRDGSNDDDS